MAESLFHLVEANLSCNMPQYARVFTIMDWYIAFADFRSKPYLSLASSLSLPVVRHEMLKGSQVALF